MRSFEDLQFEEFVEADIELITGIMKRAFDEDTRRHLGEESGGPPGYDNGDFLRKWALHEASQAFKVIKAGRPIGLVIVFITEQQENYLGTLFIDPEHQDRGTGLKVWRFIESAYPETRVWRTDTPGFSKRNHHFYVNKCGFKIVKIEKPGDRYEESYRMEKEMS